jgi:hypothetical protein
MKNATIGFGAWFRFLILGAVTVSGMAQAFPEMVRHGYTNCTSCHISPNGGGLLTKYGRSLSEDLLSTWNKEGEGQFLYGALKTPDWLELGGDLYELQLYTDTPQARDARFIFMHNDVEGAATYKNLTLYASVGYLDQAGSIIDHMISHEHYLMYKVTDQINVRGGRFDKAYGINTYDHSLFIRQNLGMDQGTETYNVEASYIGDKFDVFVTGDFGRPDSSVANAESGAAIRSSIALGDTYKVGASYYYGSNSLDQRHLFGPYGILGFTHHFFVLAEMDFQSLKNITRPGSEASFGPATYLRTDYEFVQGFHVYLTHEYLQNQFGDDAYTNAFGGGIQFFPRPHFEITGFAKHEVTPGIASTEVAALLLHYYL